MNKFFSLAMAVIFASGLAGCSKDHVLATGDNDGNAAAVSFSFDKPKGAYTQSRAGIATDNEWKIATLDVYAAVDGVVAKLIKDTDFTQVDGSGSYAVTMKPAWITSALGKTVNFYFVGNDASSAEGAHTALAQTAEDDFKNALTDFLTLDGDNKAALIEANGTNKNLLFSAVSENVRIMGKVQQTVTLKRREARFDIVNPIHSAFIIDNIYVTSANCGGFIFSNADLAAPAIPKAGMRNIAGPTGYDADDLAESVFYLYPTVLGAGKTNIVIEAHIQGSGTRLLYEVVSEQTVRANARYKIVLNPATLTFSLIVADYDEGNDLDVDDITGPGLLGLSSADGTGVVTNTSYQLIDGENATVTALLGAQSSAGFYVSVSGVPDIVPSASVIEAGQEIHPVASARAVSETYFPVTVHIPTYYVTAVPGTEVFVTFTDKANPKNRTTILLYDKTTVRIPEPKANTYIVKPNGPVIELPISHAYEHWGAGLANDANFHIKFLWTDNANGMDVTGAVADTYVKDDGDDAVVFVKPGAVAGNAVVAVTLDGVIRWSWHIWVTDYDPDTATVDAADGKYTATEGHVYRYTSTGTPNATTYIGPSIFMDRNLGALSATPGDIATHGMYYQWGRKDPFMYKGDWVDELTLPKYYDQRGTPYQIDPINNTQTPNGGDPDNMAFSIANPQTFIFRRVAAQGTPTNADWYSSVTGNSNHGLWGYVDAASCPKSVYDPCPYGWKVPAAGSVHGLVSTVGSAYEIKWTGYGREGVGSKATVGYFPAQGALGKTTGLYGSIKTMGYLWLSTIYGPSPAAVHFIRFGASTDTAPGTFNAANFTERDNAVPVRCVRE